jgi:flavin reductase (DIM6/NTAB) family NADH-FMN oxidoreductase RutF
MFIDCSKDGFSWQDVYRLAITFVLPRPIGWVSSVAADGVRNLAPFSFYNMVSANPPVVIFAPSLKRDGSEKDTLRNVAATGEFVVATATEALVERMNQCSADVGPEVDEFKLAGLTPAPARFVRPALVAESPVNLECRLVEIKRLGDGPGAGCVVFGRILAVHLDDAVLAEDGLVDPGKLKAVGRMGRLTYVRSTDTFDLPRPKA